MNRLSIFHRCMTPKGAINYLTHVIVIEFTSQGAFPIFGVPLSETFNRLWETDDVIEAIPQLKRLGAYRSISQPAIGLA